MLLTRRVLSASLVCHGQNAVLCPLQVFDIDPASCLVVSAKHGHGLDAVLSAIVEHIPAPQVKLV